MDAQKPQLIPVHSIDANHSKETYCEIVTLTEKKTYDPFELHKHEYFEIFYFIKGGGKHFIDFQNFEVHENSVHIVFPGQVHSLQRDLKTNGFVVLFAKNLMTIFPNIIPKNNFILNYSGNLQNQIIKIELPHVTVILQILQQMLHAQHADNQNKTALFFSYLQSFILELFSIKNQDIISNNSSFFIQLHEQIENNYLLQHSPSFYAEVLNITTTQLNDKLKQHFNTTMKQLINERLILEAKRKILFENMQVNEIAYALKFEDPSYFIRLFKSHTTMAPNEFRKNWLAKNMQ